MNETRDIVKRLQHFASLTDDDIREAAATITALRKERDGLREALRRISINTNDNGSGAADFARAALAAGQDRDGAEGSGG